MQRWSMAVRLSGCDKSVLGCDLGGASSGAFSVALGCDESMLGCEKIDASGAMGSLLFLSLFYFPGVEIL